MKLSKIFALWATLCVLLLSAPTFAESRSSWEVIKTSEGIEVSVLEVAQRDLPVFRGIGIIEADYWDVLAVLVDVAERVNWAHKCVETRVVRDEGARGRIIYDRIDAPWPVSDRDVVVRSNLRVDPDKKVVHINFQKVWDCDVPELEDVVRMPRMKGHYILQATREGFTKVEYQIDADPGGMLPNWVIDMASREIPFETLRGLRMQVVRQIKKRKHLELRDELVLRFVGK